MLCCPQPCRDAVTRDCRRGWEGVEVAVGVDGMDGVGWGLDRTGHGQIRRGVASELRRQGGTAKVERGSTAVARDMFDTAEAWQGTWLAAMAHGIWSHLPCLHAHHKPHTTTCTHKHTLTLTPNRMSRIIYSIATLQNTLSHKHLRLLGTESKKKGKYSSSYRHHTLLLSGDGEHCSSHGFCLYCSTVQKGGIAIAVVVVV
ncbi:hypothetical protein F4808DRAFT_397955 [Astrocystis sublimbata]|nr:hypothetical protein F4808DRAFT_397392 [Astrocystis sublimbata]KAI0191122.1 hypothetical protein F4808DRAFT_397955 [Astrocystis sublimbata]